MVEIVTALNPVHYTGNYKVYINGIEEKIFDKEKTKIINNTLEITAKPEKERIYRECTEWDFTGKYCRSFELVKEINCNKEVCTDDSWMNCTSPIIGEEEENCLKYENITYEVPDFMHIKVNNEEIIKENTFKTFTEIGEEPTFYYTISPDEYFIKIGSNSILTIEDTTTSLTLENATVDSTFIHQDTIKDIAFYAPLDRDLAVIPDFTRGNCDSTIVSAVSYSTDCKYDDCYDFVGSGDYLTCSAIPAINPKQGTMAIWVEMDSPMVDNSAKQGIFTIGNDGDAANYIQLVKRNSNDISFRYVASSTSYNAIGSSTTTGFTDTWRHIVGTWNESNGLSIYYDGLLEGTDVRAKNTSISAFDVIFTGRDYLSSTLTFDGRLDEPMIWNRSLSSEEVLALYNNQSKRFVEGKASMNIAGGKFLQLDGNGDYVDIGSINNDINVSNGTISAWIKLNPMSAIGAVFSARVDADNNIEIFWNDPVDTLDIKYKAGGTTSQVQSNALSDLDNKWHHVALTWDTSADEVKAYVDGSQNGSTQTGLGVWAGSINEFVSIGSQGEATHISNLDGFIDEVMIFNRSLLAEEIESINNTGKDSGSYSGISIDYLISHYRFDKTNSAEDDKGLNNGVLEGDSIIFYPLNNNQVNITSRVENYYNSNVSLSIGYYQGGLWDYSPNQIVIDNTLQTHTAGLSSTEYNLNYTFSEGVYYSVINGNIIVSNPFENISIDWDINCSRSYEFTENLDIAENVTLSGSDGELKLKSNWTLIPPTMINITKGCKLNITEGGVIQ